MRNPLPKNFYERNPEIVAKELLGKILVCRSKDQIVSGRIVETEAYLASGDEAAHNFKGKTKRNQSLYKEAGHIYIHTMRQYFLLDVVTEGLDIPSSILIRAVEPLEGIDIMKERRGTDVLENLTNGPSKFCMAFGIDKVFDGVDITSPQSPLSIFDDYVTFSSIRNSGRIGISKATDTPLRYWVQGHTCVSRRD